MRNPLIRKQIVPLTDEERDDLAAAAKEHQLSNGLFARALLLHGMEALNTPAIQASLAAERTATKNRISDGARAAVRARWSAEGDEN